MTNRIVQTECLDGRVAIFNSEHATRIEEFKLAAGGLYAARVHFDDGGSIELPMHPEAAAGMIWGSDGTAT